MRILFCTYTLEVKFKLFWNWYSSSNRIWWLRVICWPENGCAVDYQCLKSSSTRSKHFWRIRRGMVNIPKMTSSTLTSVLNSIDCGAPYSLCTVCQSGKMNIPLSRLTTKHLLHEVAQLYPSLLDMFRFCSSPWSF